MGVMGGRWLGSRKVFRVMSMVTYGHPHALVVRSRRIPMSSAGLGGTVERSSQPWLQWLAVLLLRCRLHQRKKDFARQSSPGKVARRGSQAAWRLIAGKRHLPVYVPIQVLGS